MNYARIPGPGDLGPAPDYFERDEIACTECHGSGMQWDKNDCSYCKGSGFEPEAIDE